VTTLDLSISVVLAIATAANLTLLFAVTRRLRMLEAGVTGVAEVPALPSAGTRVARFGGTDTAGLPVGEADLDGGPHLVAFVMPRCEPCHGVLTALRTDARFDPARTLIFIAGEPGQAAEEVIDLAHGLGRTLIVDHDGPAAAAFGGIDAFPALLAVRDGRVQSSGRSLDEVAPVELLATAG
jgi:hypothetical protein